MHISLLKILFISISMASCGETTLKERNRVNRDSSKNLGAVNQGNLTESALSDLGVKATVDQNILSRLTKKEYRYSIMDLLEVNTLDPEIVAALNDIQDNVYQGAYNNLATFSAVPNLEQKTLKLSRVVAKKLIEAPTFKKFCSDKENCIKNISKDFLPRIWRKKLSDQDQNNLQQIYKNSNNSIELLAEYILMSPHFHLKIVGKNSTMNTSDYQIGSLVSFLIAGTFPDLELQKSIENGEIAHPNALRSHINRLLKKYPQRFTDLFVTQYLGYSSLLENSAALEFKGKKIPPNEIAKEIEIIFSDLLLKGKKLNSLFMFDQHYVNANLAPFYNQSVTGSEWEAIKFENANLFSTVLMGLKFSTPKTDYPNPITRGHWVVENLLCRDIPKPSAEEIAAAQKVVETGDEELKKLGNTNPSPADKMAFYRSMNTCAVCHNHFDYQGLALEQIGILGQKRTTYYNGGAIKIGESIDGIKFSNSMEYLDGLSKSIDVSLCFVGHLNQYFSKNTYSDVGKKVINKKEKFTKLHQANVFNIIEDIAVDSIVGLKGEN